MRKSRRRLFFLSEPNSSAEAFLTAGGNDLILNDSSVLHATEYVWRGLSHSKPLCVRDQQASASQKNNFAENRDTAFKTRRRNSVS